MFSANARVTQGSSAPIVAPNARVRLSRGTLQPCESGGRIMERVVTRMLEDFDSIGDEEPDALCMA